MTFFIPFSLYQGLRFLTGSRTGPGLSPGTTYDTPPRSPNGGSFTRGHSRSRYEGVGPGPGAGRHGRGDRRQIGRSPRGSTTGRVVDVFYLSSLNHCLPDFGSLVALTDRRWGLCRPGTGDNLPLSHHMSSLVTDQDRELLKVHVFYLSNCFVKVTVREKTKGCVTVIRVSFLRLRTSPLY